MPPALRLQISSEDFSLAPRKNSTFHEFAVFFCSLSLEGSEMTFSSCLFLKASLASMPTLKATQLSVPASTSPSDEASGVSPVDEAMESRAPANGEAEAGELEPLPLLQNLLLLLPFVFLVL